MHAYDVCGLSLRSELPFPELRAVCERDPDVVLTLGPVEVSPPPGRAGGGWMRVKPDDATLSWREFATVRVLGGEAVRVDPFDGVDEEWLRTVLLGQVLTVLLAQRGLLPLHASSIGLGNGAIALAANSGGGKSTFAAALIAGGHTFLSDDVSPLRFDVPGIPVVPNVPRQKLDDESLRALDRVPESLRQVHSRESKRAVPVPPELCAGELPLRAVYVLESGDGEELTFEPLRRPAAFAQLFRHIHRVELVTAMLGEEEVMRRCGLVASAVPLVRVHRPKGLARLAGDAQRLAEHAG